MEPIIRAIIPAVWLAWLVYWFVASRDVKEAQWHEPLLSQLSHRVPFVLAAILLGSPRRGPALLTARVLPRSAATAMYERPRRGVSRARHMTC
jgi:hypothetical protein